ncbi:MAG: CubicO group peptidase (beta-lactamase class C family) [Cognaticolwellia sp.]|jgi:CubicO group peptidase (beta-lactamase class C family)
MLTWILALACRGPETERLYDSPNVDSESSDSSWDGVYDDVLVQLEADLAQSTAGAASVAVWADGGVAFLGATGKAHPIDGGAVGPQTRFGIGSTSKVITSTLVLRDVQAGRFTLKSTLGELKPDLELAASPGQIQDVSVHQLLTHQGAFYDWVPWGGSSADQELGGTAQTTFAEQVYLMNAPGAFWNYSNPNFSLAGWLGEAQGEYWPDRIAAEILEPLGMSGCTARPSDLAGQTDVAVGWGPQLAGGVGVVAPDYADPAFVRPAGAVWCTPQDMLRFGVFLMEGDAAVLADPSALHTPHVDTRAYGDLIFYGYGLFLQPGVGSAQGWHETPVWQHGGNTLGHSSIFYVLPEQGVVVSILSSGYSTDFSGTLIAALEAAGALPEAGSIPELPLDLSALSRHVGAYNDPYNVGPIQVTSDGETLSISMPLLDEYELSYSSTLVQRSTDVFYVEIDGGTYELDFVASPGADQSEWIRNRIFVATRDEETRRLGAESLSAPRLFQTPRLWMGLPE